MQKTVIAFYFEFDKVFSGAVRSQHRLISELDRARYEPVVIVNTWSPFVESLESMGVSPVVLELPAIIGKDDGLALRGGLLRKAKAWRELRRFNRQLQYVLSERNAKLLWVRNVKGVLLGGLAAKRLRIPLIWDIGGEMRSRGVMWALHNLAFLRTRKIVTQGSCVAGSIFTPWQLRRFGHKVQVNWSALARERVLEVRRECAQEYSAGDPFTVVNVASLHPNKNQMMLLKAAAKLAGRFPELRVQLIGATLNEAYEHEMRKFVVENKLTERVEFLGWQEDVAKILHGARLLCMTSRFEGVPQAVLEAMHARVPVLSTAAGGIPDVVINGTTGFLVDIDDQEGFTTALEYCLLHKDELPRIAEAAQEHVDAKFTVEQWYRRYDDIFDELLNSSR